MRSRFVPVFAAALTLAFMSPSPEAAAKPNVTVSEDAEREPANDRKFFATGYGEVHYNNVDNADDTLELHRFVIGFGYDFTDRIRFRSEVELEHGFTEQYVEFAYLDFDLTDWATLRAGAFILPIGTINQYHEPTAFNGVERPEIYNFIIPTTWMEAGFGFHGGIVDGLDYQIYAHSSLNYNDGFMGDSGFDGRRGVREGRTKLSNVEANDFAGSARLQYTGVRGLRVGASGFVGNTAQGDARVDGGLVSLIEADAKYSFEGIDVEGLVAVIFNPEAGAMTTAQRADGNIGATDTIGSRMFGFMFEGAYHLFHHAWPDAPVDLVAFARWESYDTQSAVPSGFAGDPANDRNTYTFGLTFLPVDQVAFKVDYSVRDNGSNTGNNQFNAGVGYYF